MAYTEEQRGTVDGGIVREAQLTGTVAMESQLTGTVVAPKVFYEGGVSDPATKETLGLVIVGDNLTITEEGVLSAEVPSKTSELENDAGYITSDDIPVESVNSKTGKVNLTAEDVGAMPSSVKIPTTTSDLTNDSGYITESALEPYANDMTTPVGVDAEGKLWVHAVADIESIGADKVMFEGNMVFTEQFGKYKPSGGKVTIPSDGKSWKRLLLDAYSEDKNPTITQPSIGVSSTTAKAYEVGTSVTPAYSGSFNVGKYEYGPATGVTVTTWSATNNVTNETKSTKSGTFAAYIVPDGSNYKITISGTYTDGAIPITALEAEYPSGQIKGATKTATTGAISGYRNSFYGTTTSKTAETTSAVIRALAQKSSKTLANGNSFTVNIPVGAQRVIIAYPATLRDITSIKDVNGLNADITSAFASSTVSVNGANNYTAINYKVYTLDFANPNDTANKYTVTI